MKPVGWGLEAVWAGVFSRQPAACNRSYLDGAIHWLSSLPLWGTWELLLSSLLGDFPAIWKGLHI